MNNNRVNYKKKVASTIEVIKNMTSGEGMKSGMNKKDMGTLFAYCGVGLKELGFIKNTGNATHPVYVWQDDKKVSNRTVDDVISIIRKRYRKSAKKQKLFTSAEKEIKDTLSKMKSLPTATCHSVMALVNFTDQQLWDELKSRDYMIRDNHLCKMVVLA